MLAAGIYAGYGPPYRLSRKAQLNPLARQDVRHVLGKHIPLGHAMSMRREVAPCHDSLSIVIDASHE